MQRFEKAWEAMAEGCSKGSREDQGGYRKTALGNSRWLLDDVLTGGLLKKLHCLTPAMEEKGNSVIQLCYAALSCQSQKYKTGG